MTECYITTSWDDGSPLDLRVAELLAKHGIEGTFYVPLRPPEPVITAAQMRELSSRFEIGAHTIRHVPLTELTMREARTEIIAPRSELEQITGQPCRMFCFPSGRYRRRHLQYVREAGYVGCRTVALMSLAPPVEDDGILVMPTTAQVYSHSAVPLLRNCIKRRAVRPILNWLTCARQRDWVRTAERLLDSALRQGGVFHLWGHAREVEDRGEWERLDTFLAELAARRGPVVHATNFGVCRATVRLPEEIPV